MVIATSYQQRCLEMEKQERHFLWQKLEILDVGGKNEKNAKETCFCSCFVCINNWTEEFRIVWDISLNTYTQPSGKCNI